MRPENLETIYRLSPVQEGILFHALNEPENGLYVRHLVAELSGKLEVERFKQALVEPGRAARGVADLVSLAGGGARGSPAYGLSASCCSGCGAVALMTGRRAWRPGPGDQWYHPLYFWR